MPKVSVDFDDEEFERFNSFLQANGKQAKTTYIRRRLLRDIMRWEELEAEKRRIEEEHQAKLDRYKRGSNREAS